MAKDTSSQINFQTRPIPSGPGAQQITTIGNDSMKGGSAFVSKMPKDYVIPDGSGAQTPRSKGSK